MENKNKIKIYSVDSTIFSLANESEEIEGFDYTDENVLPIDKAKLLPEINNETVLNFLTCPETKVYIVVNDDNDAKIIAHNLIANETIEISNLGNHILAQNEVLLWAYQKKKELRKNPNAEIINNDMIKEINRMLFHGREGEIGIGEFRDVDFKGNPCNVKVCNIINGEIVPVKEWQPELSDGHGRIEKLMTKLVDWTKTDDFKSLDPIERSAMFHAQFIKIHPFRDGNGRTGRMILNYMLAISGKPLTNIRGEAKEDYYYGISSAIVNNDYEPLVNVIKSNSIMKSNELYVALMTYSNEKGSNMKMPLKSKQIDFVKDEF